ncbi:cupin-like domain-containing protein [Pyxidicoccus xibeiensis]|uniref:cupin-like domain-containing protein n=1 Tax=Pyxidicoccus xibeiensis TaxID=2906759 RepID=UPI0020A7EB2B|nr:cupin-like domain-containing protein [Pyxidicoccus xibeiensis]MCP3140875.1 cupin-like domain-containing protein [Pyxidicoccus xibeiensis]
MNGAELAPEWRSWVVENLLRGTAETELVDVLVGAGVDAAVARAAVRAEAEDPCLRGSIKALKLHRKLEGLLDLYGDLYRQEEGHARVDRHESLSREAFFDRYYFQNRPVVLRGTVVPVGSWEPERVATLLEWLKPPAGAPSSRTVPLVKHPELLMSLRPPADYVVTEGQPVLSLESADFTAAEAPLRENVLVCQVYGRRRLQLVPAFELRRMRGSPEDAGAVLRLDVEVGPGDLVLLPVGWWCGYRVLETSASVSFFAFAASVPNATWAQEPVAPEPTPPSWR